MRRVKQIAAYALSAAMLATGFAGVPCKDMRAAELQKTNQNEMSDIATVTEADTETSVVINATNFPDATFRTYVAENFDTDQNGVLSDSERNGVTEIISTGKDIADLTGIEYFPNLEQLICDNNKLTKLDVSHNPNLELLYCSYNQLTSLDVSSNTALIDLYCYNNALTELDVSNNTALIELYCDTNELSSLILDGCTKLVKVECDNNKLTYLDVSTNVGLVYLICGKNNLCSIDVSNNKSLWGLYCDTNNYFVPSRTIDTETLKGFSCSKVSNVTGGELVGSLLVMDEDENELSYTYDCGNNHSSTFSFVLQEDENIIINADNFPDEIFRDYILEKFDSNCDGEISQVENVKIKSINVDDMKISDLKGIELFSYVETLRCDNNKLTNLDVSKNSKLESLFCRDNYLTHVDVSNNMLLSWLLCENNYRTVFSRTVDTFQFLGFDIARVSNVENGKISGKYLVMDDSATELTYDYDCGLGNIETFSLELDMSSQENQLAVNSTNFPDANFRQCILEQFDDDGDGYINQFAVGVLKAENSGISSIKGIELLERIQLLDCSGNNLKSIDVSQNLTLKTLYCSDNRLTNLDVSKNLELHALDCGNNQLTSLDVSNNEKLYALDCSGNHLTSLDLSRNEILEYLYIGDNTYSVTSRTIDTTTFPNFDIEKVFAVYGGELVGNVFVMDSSEEELMYGYDCGKDWQMYITLKLETPKAPGTVTLKSAKASATAITVTWEEEPNAESYIIYRKNKGTSWKKIGTSETTSYTDKTAVGGIKYTYTVKAENEIGTSETYDTTGVSATITALPGKVVLKPATIGATAIKVNWEPTATASSYIIYRHAAGESWKKIGTSTTTSYLDSTAIGGKNYAYTVKAVNGNGAATSYDKTGIIAKITARPGKVTLLAPTIGKTAIKVNWKATPTASSYIIYRHAKGESWTKIGTSTTTSYVDATAVGGKNYAYTVKAVNGNGSSTSYDKTGVIAKITALPGITTMVGATAYSGYINVKWKATATASSYGVYRKTAGGKWTKIGTTTKTAYNDKTAVKGTTYYYTVIAVNGNGACKTYDNTGVKATAK